MSKITFRKAALKDVPHIVELLANDKLGQLRENFRLPLPQKYLDAYEDITADKNQELIVLENEQQIIVGTLQMTFIPYLTYQGGTRAQVEAVRIHHEHRGAGLGEQLFLWVIERAKQRGAHVLQLTSDKQRPDAIRFYEKLGFKATHEGMKMHF